MRDKTVIIPDTVRSGELEKLQADPSHVARILRRVRRRGHPNAKLARRVARLAEYVFDWEALKG